MAYADKCFYFDWGNRMIPTRDFDDFDKISVRWRWTSERGARDNTERTKGVSIELWGIEREDGTRAENHEVVLTKESALLLAEKLRRAVAELDLEDYLADLENDVDKLEEK